MAATRLWKLKDGRVVRGCRELGCYSATLGSFCVAHAQALKPKPTERCPRCNMP